MRKSFVLYVILVCVCGFIAFGSEKRIDSRVINAIKYGAKAKITLRVIDEEGTPVTNATILANFGMTINGLKGLTDTNGLFSVERKTKEKMHYGIEKKGYYSTSGEHNFCYNGVLVKDGKWQPWNPVVTAVLRRVINPIPMYAKRVETYIPMVGKLCGYDLKKGDWVAPYGNGKVSDIVFKAIRTIVSTEEFEIEFKIFFTNKYDGFQRVDIINESKFKMPRKAFEFGYIKEYKKSIGYKPEKGFYGTETKSEERCIFRVRTVVDKKGKIQSSYYGKIPDGFSVAGYIADKLTVIFTYYLNPTPNDRNLEFDPKQNLFKNLSLMEEVRAP